MLLPLPSLIQFISVKLQAPIQRVLILCSLMICLLGSSIYLSLPTASAASDILEGENPMSTKFTIKTSDYLGSVSASGIATSGGVSKSDTEKGAKALGGSIAKTLLNLLVLGCLVMTTIAGILMVSSIGDTDRAEKGKAILTTCASALVIALLANGLIRVVLYLVSQP